MYVMHCPLYEKLHSPRFQNGCWSGTVASGFRNLKDIVVDVLI